MHRTKILFVSHIEFLFLLHHIFHTHHSHQNFTFHPTQFFCHPSFLHITPYQIYAFIPPQIFFTLLHIKFLPSYHPKLSSLLQMKFHFHPPPQIFFITPDQIPFHPTPPNFHHYSGWNSISPHTIFYATLVFISLLRIKFTFKYHPEISSLLRIKFHVTPHHIFVTLVFISLLRIKCTI